MSRKAPPQWQRVINYIMHFGSITRVQALMDISVANLPAVIDVLRNKKGYHIVTEEVESQNRYEQKITYARYYLDESEDLISGN